MIVNKTLCWKVFLKTKDTVESVRPMSIRWTILSENESSKNHFKRRQNVILFSQSSVHFPLFHKFRTVRYSCYSKKLQAVISVALEFVTRSIQTSVVANWHYRCISNPRNVHTHTFKMNGSTDIGLFSVHMFHVKITPPQNSISSGMKAGVSITFRIYRKC